jgi:hypothetical protein
LLIIKDKKLIFFGAKIFWIEVFSSTLGCIVDLVEMIKHLPISYILKCVVGFNSKKAKIDFRCIFLYFDFSKVELILS